MKPNMLLKMSIDLVMTVLLLCLMAYMRIGERAHEWMGAAMFVLFLAHHALNWRWYKNLIRGKYSPLRIFQTVVNFLVLLSMIGLMVSGIILSREVFSFLPIAGGTGFARVLHMLAAYWGFLLMSVHLGLHWGMVMGMMRKIGRVKSPFRVRVFFLRALALLICGFGIWAFLKNRIADYLFVRSQFVFFDMEQPLLLFFGEYLAMMGLWACVSYYAARLLQKSRKSVPIR